MPLGKDVVIFAFLLFIHSLTTKIGLAQAHLSEASNSLTVGATKKFSAQDVKAEFTIEGFQDRIKVSETLSKPFTKRLDGNVSIVKLNTKCT